MKNPRSKTIKPVIELFPTVDGWDITMNPATAIAFFDAFYRKYPYHIDGHKKMIFSADLTIEQAGQGPHEVNYRIRTKNAKLCADIEKYIISFAKRNSCSLEHYKIIVNRNEIEHITKNRNALEAELGERNKELATINRRHAREISNLRKSSNKEIADLKDSLAKAQRKIKRLSTKTRRR
jgi:multidrug resistance efflux pump